MSEYTSYFAVKADEPDNIRRALEAAGLRALVDDVSVGPPEPRWTVVEAPHDAGFVDVDGSPVFSVRFDPWETLKATFPFVLHLFIEENGADWRLTVSRRGEAELVLSFSADGAPLALAELERVSGFFGVPLDATTLRVGGAFDFCRAVGLPYLELEDQQHLGRVLAPGAVVLASELDD